MPVVASEYQHGEHMYCAEQINIPVTLPNLLKTYAKAAIRTQPYDLLRWTSAYFRALADGELPPVKARLEYPPHIHPSGITPHFLKTLLNQYSYDKDEEKRVGLTEGTVTTMHVTLESLLRRWRGMALSDSSLYEILMIGRLLRLPGSPEECDLYRFLAIACGLLGNNLLETMIYVCELLTDEPEGGSAMIPLKTFMTLYEYLADLDCSDSQSIIETGSCDASSTLERDEAPLLRSSAFFTAAAAASAADSKLSANASPRETEIRGRANDIAIEDTDTEESLCHLEVTSCIKDEEELASQYKGGMSCQPSRASDLEEVEAGEPGGRRWNDSSRNSLGATKPSFETETTRIPQLESRMPSERSTYNDKKKQAERELPEGTTAGELGGSASVEVTKVQEVRPRRRDVEMHSSTEEVRPVDAETTAEPQPLTLLDSPHSSPDAAAAPAAGSSSYSSPPPSSPSPGKSHVSPPEPVKAASATTGEGSIAARKSNVDRSNADKNTTKKNRDESDKAQRDKIKGKGASQVDMPRDSSEYDDLRSNGNQATDGKKLSYGQREATEDSLELGERIEDELGDIVDYTREESSVENGNEADEQVEDMAEYQPIGLENILQGMCECLEPTRRTTDSTTALSAPTEPLDLVHEFIERMRAECPAGLYIPPEVPGIGPPVSPTRVTDVGLWLSDCARRQEGCVAPRNLRHFLCPNLDENTCCEDYYRTKTMCP